MKTPATKSVLITGASTGIGRDAALHMDRLGWKVFAGVRKDQDAQSLAAAGSDKLVPVRVDVTKQAEIDACVALIDEHLQGGQLGGLVNNAGIAVGGPLEILALHEIRWQFDVNVFGLIAMTQAAIPLMRRSPGARIVHVGSIAGKVTTPLLSPYCASKHAVEAISDGLRGELRHWDIWSCVVEPGVIETPIWDKADDEFDEMEAKLGETGLALYGDTIKRFATRIRNNRKMATSVEAVSIAIEHALCSERPKTRYPVGPDAKMASVIRRIVPDRAMDWLLVNM